MSRTETIVYDTWRPASAGKAWLVDEAVGYVHYRAWLLTLSMGEGAMPVVQSLMDNLVKRYGAGRGRRIYYAMEAEGKGPFAKGNKYHELHKAVAERAGGPPIERTKKPRRPSRGRRG